MSGKEGSYNKVLMIQCPYCKTVFAIDNVGEIICPKCKSKIELVAVPSDSLDIELTRAFVHFIIKAIDVVFSALEKRIEAKQKTGKHRVERK